MSILRFNVFFSQFGKLCFSGNMSNSSTFFSMLVLCFINFYSGLLISFFNLLRFNLFIFLLDKDAVKEKIVPDQVSKQKLILFQYYFQQSG